MVFSRLYPASLALGLAIAPLAAQAAAVPAPALDGPTLIADVNVENIAGLLFDALGPVLFLETADGDDVPLDARFSVTGFTDTGFVFSVFDNTDFSTIVSGDSVAVALDGASLTFGFATTVDVTGLFGPLIHVSVTGLFPENLFEVDYSEAGAIGFVTSAQIAPVPLPLSAPLLLAALGALGLAVRRPRIGS